MELTMSLTCFAVLISLSLLSYETQAQLGPLPSDKSPLTGIRNHYSPLIPNRGGPFGDDKLSFDIPTGLGDGSPGAIPPTLQESPILNGMQNNLPAPMASNKLSPSGRLNLDVPIAYTDSYIDGGVHWSKFSRHLYNLISGTEVFNQLFDVSFSPLEPSSGLKSGLNFAQQMCYPRLGELYEKHWQNYVSKLFEHLSAQAYFKKNADIIENFLIKMKLLKEENHHVYAAAYAQTLKKALENIKSIKNPTHIPVLHLYALTAANTDFFNKYGGLSSDPLKTSLNNPRNII